MTTRVSLALVVLAILVSCDRREANHGVGNSPYVKGRPKPQASLVEQRRNIKTKLLPRATDDDLIVQPPANLFQVVQYDAPVGKLSAYLSLAAQDGKRRAAIIWIHGGDCNAIGPFWDPGPRENDQSASAFREAGIVTMFPALRGGNGGPGRREGFFGEVDDVISAAEYLARQDFIDPARIYLGGHSTGGTLALLVAELAADRFRAVFCFGPVDNVAGYGSEYLPFDSSDDREVALRSPIFWLQDVHTPTFVFEGTTGRSNIDSLQSMARVSRNTAITFLPVPRANHFSILFPVTHLVAGKIVNDTGPTMNIEFTQDELASAIAR